MWERYTERAKQAVFFAQEEAIRLGQESVAPEHLLFGILQGDKNSAMHLLERIGISREVLQNELSTQMASRPVEPGYRPPNMRLSAEAKRVCDLAYYEACQINCIHIGTEFLLLGLIREETSLANRILSAKGFTLIRARREL